MVGFVSSVDFPHPPVTQAVGELLAHNREGSCSMLKSDRVLLRPMKPEDVARQHEFNQDLELYGLDSSSPRVASLESVS